MRDPRNKLRAETQLSSPAHAAGVTAVAAKGDLVITCGLTADRQGVVSVDPFVKVVDVRVGCRVLNVLQFPAGAVALAFHPKFNGTVVLGGESGLVQTQDADRGGPGSAGAGFFSQAPLDLMGQRLTSLAAASSGEAFAFGDTAAAWSIQSDRVHLIQIRQRSVMLGDVAQLGDRRDVTVHRVHALERHQLRSVRRDL